MQTAIAKVRIGIIGFGNMGSAIYARLKVNYKLVVFDKDNNKLNNLVVTDKAGEVKEVLKKSDLIILAIKPQDFAPVLEEIKNDLNNKLVVSIAAGIATDYIAKYIPGIRVIRAMPNMPAKIGEGVSCLCKGASAAEDDLNLAAGVFASLGKTVILDEDKMDAATAISGSGPGYLYDLAEGKSIQELQEYAQNKFIPAFIAAAKNLGFSHEEAKILATTTAKGSVIFLKNSKLKAAELKKQIASPGGTTEAGLAVLHRGGSIEEAVKAAFARAKELSGKG